MTRVVLIDGPLPPGTPGLVACEVLRPGDGEAAPAHAAAMAAALRAGCPNVCIVGLAVFGAGLTTDAQTVTRALHRAAALHPALVLAAFGMARADAAMEAACAALGAAGACMVAAAPARGGAVWPAAYTGVLAVQGDARCGPGEWSHLALPQADFGACAVAPGHEHARGASTAAAHFAGLLAQRLAGGLPAAEALKAMRREARWQGRERRGMPAG